MLYECKKCKVPMERFHGIVVVDKADSFHHIHHAVCAACLESVRFRFPVPYVSSSLGVTVYQKWEQVEEWLHFDSNRCLTDQSCLTCPNRVTHFTTGLHCSLLTNSLEVRDEHN